MAKMRVLLICERCGCEYRVVPSQAEKSRFCSRKCLSAWQSENQVGENHPCWKGKIKVICEQCGKEFEVKPSDVGRARFCSKECYGKWKSENLVGENNSGWKGGKVKVFCEQCGDKYEVYPGKAKTSRFCSRKCHAENQVGENHPNWIDGKSILYPPEFNETLKRYIRKRDHSTCVLCGEDGWVVHHIDYDKQNSDPVNLIALCDSCHARTGFNRDYWKRILSPVAVAREAGAQAEIDPWAKGSVSIILIDSGRTVQGEVQQLTFLEVA